MSLHRVSYEEDSESDEDIALARKTLFQINKSQKEALPPRKLKRVTCLYCKKERAVPVKQFDYVLCKHVHERLHSSCVEKFFSGSKNQCTTCKKVFSKPEHQYLKNHLALMEKITERITKKKK